MKRILVLGSGGAGKSTFSKRLGGILDIDVIHLDRLYWRPNWQEVMPFEWQTIVGEIISRESWIMDGNYTTTREMRIRACDSVIFLDMSRHVCLYRILKRTLIYHGQSRPDMPPGCNERFDLEFALWVWNYPNRSKKKILETLGQFPGKNIVVLRSSSEVDAFLESLG
ncbi:MAG: DNA topology modulation protein [Pyrinomonadaceae bacterium]